MHSWTRRRFGGSVPKGNCIGPFGFRCLCELGDVLFKEKRYSEAIGNYERALAVYPVSTIALFSYAEACLAAHRYDDSVPALKKVLALSPERPSRIPPLGKSLSS